MSYQDPSDYRCERCGALTPYYLHDYCINCHRNLCQACVKLGCCKHTPAELEDFDTPSEKCR